MNIYEITEADIEDTADSDAILGRGKSYYREGKITSMRLSGDTIIARVQGNYGLYKVEVSADEDGLSAECNCPYGGPGCKHVAAVLFNWVDNMPPQGRAKIPPGKTGKASKKRFLSPALTPLKHYFDRVTLNDIASSAPTEIILQALETLNRDGVKIRKRDYAFLQATIGSFEVAIRFVDPVARVPTLVKNCTCRSLEAMCPHILAVLLHTMNAIRLGSIPPDYEDRLRKKVQQEQYALLVRTLDSSAAKERNKPKQHQFFFTIATNSNNAISLLVERAQILTDGSVGKMYPAIEYWIEQDYATFPDSLKAAFLLMLHALNKKSSYTYSGRKLAIDALTTDHHAALLEQLRRLYMEYPAIFINCKFPPCKGTIGAGFEERDGHYYFTITVSAEGNTFSLADKRLMLIGEDKLWVCVCTPRRNAVPEHTLFEVHTGEHNLVRRLIKFSGLEIEKAQLPKLIETYHSKISEIGRLMLPDSQIAEEITNVEPTPRIFLQGQGQNIHIDLKFLYCNKEVARGAKHDILFLEQGKSKNSGKMMRIKRIPEAEQNALSLLLQSNVGEQNGELAPMPDPLTWLADSAPSLIAAGFEIFGQNALFNCNVRMQEPTLNLDVSSGIDWFDLKAEADFGGQKIGIAELSTAINNHERYIQLADRSMGIIPKKWLSKLSGVTGFLEIGNGKNSLKASTSQLKIVEAMMEIADNSSADEKFRQMQTKFKQFHEIKEAPLPSQLHGSLRDYQKAGYNWLYFLKDFSFGGCLADDMGLGKTIQALTLLLKEKENGNKKPSLIVVPTSLVFNWVEEIKKFTPALKPHVHYGLERLQSMGQLNSIGADIIITTYGTLRNDFDLLKRKQFFYIILDESQMIKNPLTKTARSVNRLKSHYRLVLTGTPVENNSVELWSQFSFLNPGLLGSMEYFKKTFAKSIEKEKDEDKTESLKNMINPFLLRRKKEAVAKELPEKQITTVYCEMEPEQDKVYEYWKEKYRNEVKESVREKGLAMSRMKILEGLTMLRQICNHPLLIDESYTGESGKFNMLTAQVEEAISEGHKVLLYSAFVKMLNVFEKHFTQKRIKFIRLDGQTAMKDRKKAVEEFQQNKDTKLFLISLKAGGLGLNLTAADYVFLTDPWWNPAAEMQATDRAHRIGQANKVFVYKAITKETVEEKILALQETKLQLVKDLITVEEGIFKKLTEDDVNKLFT